MSDGTGLEAMRKGEPSKKDEEGRNGCDSSGQTISVKSSTSIWSTLSLELPEGYAVF